MKGKTRATGQYRRQFLFSYGLLYFLPIVVLCLLVYQVVFTTFQEAVIDRNRLALENASAVLDTKVEELERVTYRVFTNPGAESYAYGASPLVARQLIKDLSNAMLANQFIHEMLLYTGPNNYLLSSSGSYTVRSFTEGVYRFTDWNAAGFQDMLDQCDRPVFYPAQDVYRDGYARRLLTALYPSTPERRVMIFLLDESSVAALFAPFRGHVAIFDERGALLYAPAEAASLFSAFSDFQPLLSGSPARTLTVEGTRYLSAAIASTQTSWTFVALTPYQEVFLQFTSVRNLFVLGVCVLLLSGVPLIGLFMRINYHPIRALRDASLAYLPPQDREGDEISQVRQSLEGMSLQNEHLREQLVQSIPARRTHHLTELIKGNYASLESFNRAAAEAGLCLPYPRLCIVVTHTAAPVADGLAEGIEAWLAEHALPGACRRDVEDKLVLVLSVPEGCGLLAKLQQLQQAMLETFDTSLSLGVSTLCEDPQRLWKHYIEASTALDYRLIAGQGIILPFENLPKEAVFDPGQNGLLIQRMITCIRQEDAPGIHLLFQGLQRDPPSLFAARMLAMETAGTVLRQIYGPNKPVTLPDSSLYNTLALTKVESVNELLQVAKRFCMDALEHLATLRSPDTDQVFQAVKTYVDAHCCDLNFSVQAAAEQFGFSAPAFSQFFKDNVQTTLSKYVNERQMERAKTLLAETTLPISQIVRMVGHYDASNFIRKFKLQIGLTPGEYRKMHQKAEG